MADNSILPATGETYGSDDIGGVKYERIKLIHGIDGVNDGDVALTNPFPVVAGSSQKWFDIDVPGVTNAIYAAGDQFGTIIEITNAVRATGGTGWINSMLYYDNDDVQGALDWYFFHDTVTLAADNAAYAVSDTDARKRLFGSYMTYVVDDGANRFGQVAGVSIPYFCTATSLYLALIARTTPTPTGGTTGQHIRIAMTRD